MSAERAETWKLYLQSFRYFFFLRSRIGRALCQFGRIVVRVMFCALFFFFYFR